MDKEAFDTLVRFNLTPHKTLFNTFQYIYTHIHTYTLVDDLHNCSPVSDIGLLKSLTALPYKSCQLQNV